MNLPGYGIDNNWYSFKQAQAPPIFTPPVLGMQHPSYDGPADFLVLVLVTTIVCGVLNLTSLIFGTIALVMVVAVRIRTCVYTRHVSIGVYPTTPLSCTQARNRKGAYDYRSAQQYSVAAIALSFCNIIWTLAWATAIIGSVVSFARRRYLYYY